MANRHSQIFTGLACDEKARSRLVEAVVAEAHSELELEALPVNDEFLVAVERRCRALKLVCFREPLRNAPFAEISGSFEAFRQHGINPSTRRKIEQKKRGLVRDTGATLKVVETPHNVTAELEECFAVEVSGWKGRDGTAILSHADTGQFFRDLGRALADDDVLRLSTLRIGPRLVAFDIEALDGRRLWWLKTGYDEEFARYSPGRVLQLAVIERCFELGLDAIEMLGASDPHKLSLATGVREHCVFRSYRRAPLELGRFAYRRYVRPALKRSYIRYGGLSTRMALQRILTRLRGPPGR